jgi:ATP-dependent Clp protease ATP-binding subunit ClpC
VISFADADLQRSISAMSNYYKGAFQEGRNLTEESARFPDALFRSELVTKIVQTLARRRSVLLVGASGVGKTRVVQQVAREVGRSGRAKIFEFSVPQLLTGTKFLGEWESKAGQIVEGALAAGAMLYFSDIWNLSSAGTSANRDHGAWDLFRPYLEQGRLQLIGEITPEQLSGVGRMPGFTTLFETISVPPLGEREILEIMAAEAKRLRLELGAVTIRRALELCQQFLPVIEGPGPALELLAQIRDYQSQKREVNEPEELSPRFAEKVFSIYSGLPLFVVSPSATKPVNEIIAWFEERVIGQRDAVRAVVDTIALYKAGLHDPTRPIGSFLFVGPTGVGKTELARALAKFLFGTESRLLRFDLSEYKDYHAFQLLIGNPHKPEQPAALIDPVRAKPFQVVLLDEIEKAHANVWDLLLQLLDEGRLTPASGKTVSFRNTIVIATSNVGARDQSRAAPGFVAEAAAANDRLRQALEAQFRPEFLNRFQHVVSFHRLSEEHVRQIAKLELARVLSRQGITARRIAVDITPAALDLIVRDGYDEKYGARALRRTVQRHVTVPIATLLLARPVEDGSILRLVAAAGGITVEVIDTPETRARKAEARPLKTRRFGQVSSRKDIEGVLAELAKMRADLVQELHPIRRAREAVSTPQWTAQQAPEDLIRWARQREAALEIERRLDRLAQTESELATWLERAATREERQRLMDAIARLDLELAAARRELVVMPDGSIADAIVELAALDADNGHAIELFHIYSRWAKRRGYSADMICEPLGSGEPILVGFRGPYAYGYLRLESGHHRFRDERSSGVVRVGVYEWRDAPEEVSLVGRRALKKLGLLGGRVRSRVEVAGMGLVLQNERTLIENASFAAVVAASYRRAARPADVELRRYDRNPFLLKDHLLGSIGRSEALAPEGFHDLLAERVEVAAASVAASGRPA